MHASYGLGATIGPLLVTALLANEFGWRLTFAAFSVTLAAVSVVFGLARHRWGISLFAAPVHADLHTGQRERPRRRGVVTWPSPVVVTALVFSAVETGVESGAGIWGYLF